MGVKDTLKQFADALDEWLLKEPATADPRTADALLGDGVEPLDTQASEASDAADTVAVESRQDDSLLDDDDNDATSNTTTGPRTTLSVPIYIHTYIDTILSPNNVQIASLRKIDANLLEPFEDGTNPVILIAVQTGHVMKTKIESIHNAHVIVERPQSAFFRNCGDTLLMIVPVLTDKRYVLQVTIEKIGDQAVALSCRDPRYEARYNIQLTTAVPLRLLPTNLPAAISQRELRLTRCITSQGEKLNRATLEKSIDQLYEPHAASSAAFMRRLKEIPAFPCDLRDISLGGTCLSLSHPPESEELLRRLILLHLVLPALPSLPPTGHPRVTLEILGAIRGLRTTGSSSILHVQFLQRLPEDMMSYLEALERRCLMQQ